MARTQSGKGDDGRPYVLKGDRIGFKTLRKEDVPLFTTWFQNLEFATCLTARGLPQTIENEQDWYDRNSRIGDSGVQFGIFELKSGRHIGNCGLFNFQRHDCATFGIGIGEPSAWNRGYGAEASRLMVEYGFFFLNLYNIRLNVFSFNERGRRAYLKAGFKEVGRVRGAVVVAGERFDDVIMDITRDDVDLSRMRRMVPLIDQFIPSRSGTTRSSKS